MTSHFEEVLERFNEAVEFAKNIAINENACLKIDINKDWYLIGSKMNYRIVKITQIQEHRFTKAENVGNDKFETMGFVPSLEYGIKSILNMSIMDLIANENKTSLDNVCGLIEKMKEDCSNLKIAITKEQDEEYLEDEYTIVEGSEEEQL